MQRRCNSKDERRSWRKYDTSKQEKLKKNNSQVTRPASNNQQIKLLCEENKLESALALFKKDPDSYGANYLVNAYSKQRRDLDGTINVYRILREAGVRPNVFVIGVLINACRRCGDLGRMLRLALEDIVRFDLVLDDILTHALAAACGDAGDAVAAKRLCERLRLESSKKVKVDVIDCGQLCKAFLARGDLEGALGVLESMTDSWGILPDPQLCTVMLSGCSKVGALDVGQRVAAVIKKRGVAVDDYLAAALISMYAKCGTLSDAVSIFETHRKKKGRIPSAGVWAAIIGAYAKHGHSQAAHTLYGEMVAEGVKLDRVTILIMLPVCGDIGALALGRDLHRLAVESGIPMDDFFGPALISMYSRVGGFSDAVALFDSMKKKKIEGGCGVGTWTAMIGLYGNHGYTEQALALYDEMTTTSKVSPNEVTFVAALTACSHGGMVEKALKIIASMPKFGVKPDVRHHNCIIDALGRAGHLKEAEAYLLANESCCSDIISWGTLLGACRIHGDLVQGERAGKHARLLKPDEAGSHVLLSNIYASAQQWDEKDRIRQQMKNEGVFKVPGKSCIELDAKVHEFMVGDTRHEKSTEIHEYLEKLWTDMKAAGYEPKTSTVLHNISEEEKDCHLCHHSEKLAISFGLLSTPEKTPLTVIKNLCVSRLP